MANAHKKPRARYDEGVETDAEKRRQASAAATREGRREGVGGVLPYGITQETEHILLAAIANGLSFTAACAKAGIHYGTFADWMLKGSDAKTSARLKTPEAEAEAVYAAFVARVRAAESAAEERAVASITGAMERDWRAGAWWLAKRNKAEWGDNTAAVAVEATGSVSIVLPDNGRDRISVNDQES